MRVFPGLGGVQRTAPYVEIDGVHRDLRSRAEQDRPAHLDMQKYFQALFTEKLISEATLQQTYEGYSRLEKTFGFGWFLSYYIKEAMLADHGGASGVFRAYAATVPERELGVIALTNGSRDTLDEFVEVLVYNAF